MTIEPILATPSRRQKQVLVYSKFEVLRFHQYERVLFLDADTLPLCNLDYYFHLSHEQDVFGSNLIYAYRTEPSNAGFFMLKPEPGDWETFLKIPPYQDEYIGFGQPLLDHGAESVKANFTKWNWYYANYDQGLLYHWVHFVKKDYTHVVKNRVQRWKEVDGNMTMIDQIHNFSYACSNEVPVQRQRELLETNPVYRHFLHFTGEKKAWQRFAWNHSYVGGFPADPPLFYFSVWGVALREAWRQYELPPIRDLFPTISTTWDAEIEQIQRFLDS